jgi:microcompartment protein CcmL/EutN
MINYPSIALLEFSEIALGIKASDAMIKRSPITMLKTGTVSRGKFMILIGGSVASVEEAYFEGISIGKTGIIDSVILHEVHSQVHDAILGNRNSCKGDALCVIETKTVATIIRSTDAAIKSAKVDIVEMRLADALGGKAFTLFTGDIENVEYALQIAKEKVVHPDFWVSDTIIPRLHEEMIKQLNKTTLFFNSDMCILKDGETLHVIGQNNRNSDTM